MKGFAEKKKLWRFFLKNRSHMTAFTVLDLGKKQHIKQ